MQDKGNKPPFDAIVVGAGPLGCFTALALAHAGVKVAVCDTHARPGDRLRLGLHALWPTPNDPPTRADVAHGREVALYLNAFCTSGVAYFHETLAPLLSLPASALANARNVRMGVQEFERTELGKAVELKLGLSRTENPVVFEEAHRALVLNSDLALAEAVARAFEAMKIHYASGAVEAIEETSAGCTVRLENGAAWRCEVAVVALGSSTGRVLPAYEKVLLPMTDLMMRFEGELIPNEGRSALPGGSLPFAFRGHSGHVAGVIHALEGHKVRCAVSGPRFLLPDAGVACDLTRHPMPAGLAEKTGAFHAKSVFPYVGELLGATARLTPASSSLGLDCLPCDELPLLGELGRLGKVIGGGGWLGTGLSSGSFAAKILTDLVVKGRSEDLHPRLTPRRLLPG